MLNFTPHFYNSYLYKKKYKKNVHLCALVSIILVHLFSLYHAALQTGGGGGWAQVHNQLKTNNNNVKKKEENNDKRKLI